MSIGVPFKGAWGIPSVLSWAAVVEAIAADEMSIGVPFKGAWGIPSVLSWAKAAAVFMVEI